MNTQIRRKLEMATRVRQFSRAHPSTDPGYGIVLNRFEERLNRAETIAARQHNGLNAARGARVLREELRRVLHFQLLRYLVAVGEVVAKDRAELAARFELPSSNASNLVFLTAVRALVAMAESQRELLVSEGMSAVMLDDLGKKVSEFETASESVRAARLDHIGARTDLDVITGELQELVRVLDGINRYRYGKDPEAMAEWTAAKDVPGQPKAVVAPPAAAA